MDDWRNNERGVVSLSDCEYTQSGTENGSYSLSHGGTYYVNPSIYGTPQQNTPFAGLNLEFQDGMMTIFGNNVDLYVNNVNKGVTLDGNAKYHPWWGNSSGSDATNKFYLLKANADRTNTDIPGYEIANYASRADGIYEEDAALYQAIVKFSDSAKAYLQAKQAN